MEFVKQRPWIVPLFAISIGFIPILVSFFRQQFVQPEYQAFPIMLAAAGIFLYSRIMEATPVDRQSVWVNAMAWVMTVVAAGLLLTSFLVYSPWLAMVAFVTYGAAIVASIWQYWRVSGLFGIWLLVALLVPPPLDRDKMLIERLQLFSSRVTSVMLDGIGVLHVSQGNTITLSDRELFVDEACSGIVSLISIIYCIAIYCLWQRRRLVHLGLLVVIGVAWTVLMNSLRLIVIALSWSWYQVDLIKGWPHSLLGLGIFAVSAAVVFSVDRFLSALMAPIRIRGTEEESSLPRTFTRYLVDGWNWLIASEADNDEVHSADEYGEHDVVEPPTGPTIVWPQATWSQSLAGLISNRSVFGYPATIGFATLGFAYLLLFLPQEVSQTSNIVEARKIALELDADAAVVPPDWKLVRFSSDRRADLFRWDNWGQYSRTYELEDGDGIRYQVSCDFMFGPHWHDLRVCYRGTGWQIQNEQVLELAKLPIGPQESLEVESSLTAPDVVEQFTIRRVPDVRDGLVIYGAFRANGSWFNRPRGRGLWQDLVAHIVQGRDRAAQADCFQVQVTTFYEGAISPVQKQRAEWLMHHGVNFFRERLTESNP